MPRGARSASVRWWLFSAISSNFAFWTTWRNQKHIASTAKTTMVATWRMANLTPIRLRSSVTAISFGPT